MRIWRRLVSITACLVAPASGQERWEYRVELFGTATHNRFYSGDDLWAAGRGFGAGAGVRPFTGRLRGLGFEVQGGTLGRQETSVTTASARTFNSFASRFWAAVATYHFAGRTRFQPYLSGGLGLTSVDQSFNCDGCVFNVDPQTGALIPVYTESRVDSTEAGIAIAAGLKISVHPNISIRPEVLVLDTTPGSGHNWAWLRLQVGVGFHF